jgi:hypothetical protein
LPVYAGADIIKIDKGIPAWDPLIIHYESYIPYDFKCEILMDNLSWSICREE